MSFMKSVYGRKTLSGVMATVSWNTNEALWVHRHTGRWPALNCFDYIHLDASSPGSWIDYGDITPVERWYREGGIVAAMWHWRVPSESGGTAFYSGKGPEKTSFDVRKVFEPESPEYALLVRDIDRMAGYLRLLRERDIPVLWRPLHEAGGRWFWWGMDAEGCKALWRLMHERFDAAGLDNLIWVFTPAAAWREPCERGFDWYPGDDVVDIIGQDIYNKPDGTDILCADWLPLNMLCPDKMLALSECGHVALVGSQWNVGARWLFFMPWYDYARTVGPTSEAFSLEDHSHADAAWWRDAFSHDFVLSREDLPTAGWPKPELLLK